MTMFDSHHQLEKTFGMIPDGEREDNAELILPEIKDLNTIVDFAMIAYKSMMDNASYIEPKNQLRYFETAERYLAQAKDAMYKIESLKLQRDKLNMSGKAKSKDSKADEGSDKPTVGGKPRSELYVIKEEKKVG